MLKFLLNLIMLLALLGVIFYFLPRKIKIDQLERLADFVPESIKEKTEEFLLTPAEKREKYIVELETKLEALQGEASAEAEVLVSEMKALIEKLREENDELSFAEIAKEKLIEQFLKKDPVPSEE